MLFVFLCMKEQMFNSVEFMLHAKEAIYQGEHRGGLIDASEIIIQVSGISCFLLTEKKMESVLSNHEITKIMALCCYLVHEDCDCINSYIMGTTERI